MAMRIHIIAGAKNGTVFCVIPLRVVIAVRGTKFQAFGEGRFRHEESVKEKGLDLGYRWNAKSSPYVRL
jgi:hypothetical protein